MTPAGPSRLDAFAGIVAFLQDDGRPRPRTDDASERAARLRMAAEHLRSGPPEVQPVAEAFERYLATGGELERLLGVAVARGRADEVPHRVVRRQARDDGLKALAATMPGNVVERAEAIARMLIEQHPEAVAIHHAHGPVPRSARQLVRILRGGK